MNTNDYISIAALIICAFFGLIAVLNNFKEKEGALTGGGVVTLLIIIGVTGGALSHNFLKDIEETSNNKEVLTSLNDLIAISKSTIQRLQQNIEKRKQEIELQQNTISDSLTTTKEVAERLKESAKEQQVNNQTINELLEELVLIQSTLSVNVNEQETTTEALKSALTTTKSKKNN